MSSCKFSIITVCFNSDRTIEKTLQSVLRQQYRDYEYFIVDGASSDNTVSIIKNYELLFEGRLHWISEKDSGIYDAMNKGLRLTDGDYVVFLNADDQMMEESLSTVSSAIMSDYGNHRIYYGDSISAYQNGENMVTKVKEAFPLITMKTLGCGMGVVHQCMYTEREVFDEVGAFNLKYRVGADWDFLIRCVKAGIALKYIREPLCIFLTTGVSQNNHHAERHQIRRDNGMYKVIDIEMLKDVFNPKNILQAVVGPAIFQKIRYVHNNHKKS